MLFDPGENQRILIGKKLVDRADRDVRVASNVLDRCGPDAESPEPALGRIEDALALEVTFGCDSVAH
jgi:hypothetical protein